MPGAPAAKRRRITRACDQCRRRKSKCDGEQPACSICRSIDRTCTYDIAIRHRGLQQGYVRSLEMSMGLFLDQIPDSENTLRRVLRAHRDKARSAAGQLADLWRNSKLAKDVARLLNPEADEEETASELEPVPEPVPVPESIPEPESMPESMPVSIPEPAQVPGPALEPEPEPVYTHYLALPFPENTDKLPEYYFAHIHSWLPMVERREVLRIRHTPPDAITRKDATPFLAGDLSGACRLSGELTRKLKLVEENAMVGRYQHTLNACILLENLIAGAFDMTPQVTIADRNYCRQVDENDVDEWEKWLISRRRGQTSVSKDALRSLSALNLIHDLMTRLTRILHPCSTRAPFPAHDLLIELKGILALIGERYPYKGLEFATPTVLTLHLTASFAIFALVKRCGLFEPSVKDLVFKSFRSTLDMLDAYRELTGTLQPPLLCCFVHQIHGCLRTTLLDVESPDKELLISRLTRRAEESRFYVATTDRHLQKSPHPPYIVGPETHRHMHGQSANRPLKIRAWIRLELLMYKAPLQRLRWRKSTSKQYPRTCPYPL
ncbi:hypothetical protein BO70DRAFT_422979 [Aspergillus heteromorphus CBS 117.55]|uniref:Zn(2)-C6 fungal-type domain-containing protein n=1 Tax=Aspergillus heteromorphus CBS 117.55 TaxID=1448321 RepID=A0A317WJQ4_9EURO|nr:uncharacterized protein BO70DRAFT_422979 [Aspergillus heteromorphus CBS 117.55]PWY85891.1 hypothetical protein BO70DRAFT_422979 [Aspergillus heteromorphus CBS 117.55]